MYTLLRTTRCGYYHWMLISCPFPKIILVHQNSFPTLDHVLLYPTPASQTSSSQQLLYSIPTTRAWTSITRPQHHTDARWYTDTMCEVEFPIYGLHPDAPALVRYQCPAAKRPFTCGNTADFQRQGSSNPYCFGCNKSAPARPMPDVALVALTACIASLPTHVQFARTSKRTAS